MEIYFIITISIVLLYIIFVITKKLRNLERERVNEQNYLHTQRRLNNNFIVHNNINVAIQNSKNSFITEINERINKFKKIKLNNYIQENKDTCCINIDTKNNYNCSICYDTIDKEEDIYLIPCNHVLHKKCITDIAINNPICPFCRENLFV
jgi:anion-transporting  ArsA/GET3 family ATPase